MPTELIHNITTGEVTEREFTAEEIAAGEARLAAQDLDLSDIRGGRSERLRVSDWTQGNDSPLSDSKKAEWATYRQELRDFPVGKTKVSEFAVDSDGRMIWPTEPS